MWWITGLIISYLIQGCFTQPQDGFLSQGLDPSSGGFRSSGMSPDGSMVSRGGGFDSGFGAASGGQGGGDIGGFSPMGGGAGGFGSFTPGGSGGGSASGGECAMDQRVQGIRCSGQGRDVTDCPSGSTCYRAGGYCCWENISPVEAPCEDPMMQGSTFVQCSPGDQSQTCPGSCHRCQTLGGDMSMGLCCPQITRPGCENSSPMRNAFEEARRRIMGSGSSLTGTSDTSGTRGGDRTTPTRTPDRRFGTVAPPMGFDFGLPSPGGGAMGSQGALCPDRSPPLGRCSATSPCRRDQTCSNIRNGVGGCCSLGTRGMDGMSRFPGGPGGMSPGMTLRMPSCPDGRPSASRCSSGMPCGPGLSCLPVPGGDAVCCPFSPRGMTRAPGIPSMPPGGPGMIGLGMPGVPGMPGAPSMPGAPGMPRMPGMSSMPGMAGRRIPLEMLARRRELMGRDFSRSRSLAPGGRGTRPFGPVISGRDLRGPRF